MRNLFLVGMLSIPLALNADVRVLIEFDGDEHRIVRYESITSPKYNVPKPLDKESKASKSLSVLTMTKNQATTSIFIDDPRVIRAPLSKKGGSHEAFIVRKKGSYIITLKGNDVDLENLYLQLPEQKSKIKVKIK